MNYDRPYRGGGHRRRQREDWDRHDRREVLGTPADKLRTAIIKLGEVDVLQELPLLEKQIREHVPLVISNISEAFRIAVTEQPYKIPYYAALLRLLHNPEGNALPADGASLGKQILEDFWKGFQAYLDKLAWRDTRLCIHFFAHLTMAGLVSSDSMLGLLRSFTAVLDEFGVSHGRAKKAALCAAEGLMIAGPMLTVNSTTSVTDLISIIQGYNDTTTSSKWLVQPAAKLYSHSVSIENANELLETLLTSLKVLNATYFAETEISFPRPYANYPDLDPSIVPFDLPSVLVPPEVIELDGLSNDSGEDAQVKKEEWPEYFIRLFDNDITPDPNTPAGYAVRSALLDIIDIFEINRREAARLLLEYPKWILPGTFKPKPGAPATTEPIPGQNWQLESTIIETVLGAYLLLPESSHKSIYYIGLITELCKLSPPTVGPSVGKSIRKLYSNLSDGLDVELSRRFAEWFAVHMSNFGFQWVWKEWIPDLTLAVQHPRRAFMRRALEFEIRLSYHDRILKTLPEQMQFPDAHTVPDQAPSPNFEYDDPVNPHHDAAQSVLNLFRGRSSANDVISHLETLKNALETAEDGHLDVDAIVCSIAVQSLLHIGSRSFSHLLNAIERYLPLLRNLASGGSTSASTSGGSGNAEAKAVILTATAAFWKYNRHMIGIVFDKLMQYQIVDPTDVIGWIFVSGLGRQSAETSGKLEGGSSSLSAFDWDLLKGALDKANGRVMIARRRVTALRKEDDETRARAKASGSADVNSMEVEPDAKQDVDDPPPVDSPALISALKAFTSLTREQKAALSCTLDGFVSCLTLPHTQTVLTEKAWHNRAAWGGEEWNAWETWGWYRHFCRVYEPYLRNYSKTLWAVSFAKFEGSSDPALVLLMKVWNIATGGEV